MSTMIEKAEWVRTQLGLKQGLPIHDIVRLAIDQLGIKADGLNLADKVDVCFAAVSPQAEPAGAPPVVQGTPLAVGAAPKPAVPAFNLTGNEPPPFDVSAFLGTFQSTKVEWTPVDEVDKKNQRLATIMSIRVVRQLDANGCWTGRADAKVRVLGFVEKQVPLYTLSGRGLRITQTNTTPAKAGVLTQITITSPTTAQGEGDGSHYTYTMDPRTGTAESVVRDDATHQVVMRVTYQKVG